MGAIHYIRNHCTIIHKVIVSFPYYSFYIDVDECSESTDGCEQTCNNTVGSYMCSCGSGYRLANNGLMCNGKCCLTKLMMLIIIIL